MSKISPAQNWYRATINSYSTCTPLVGTIKARVVVVGAGYAGLNTALGLAERGVRDVVLLEREQIGFGASGRNGGFVFAGHSLGEEALVAKLGLEKAKRIFLRTIQAVELIRSRIKRYEIACDPVDEGIIWANWFRDPDVLRSRQQFLAKQFGVDWEWVPHQQLRQWINSERYCDGLLERNAFHMHPLNYAAGIAQAAIEQGVTIHEDTPALGLKRVADGWRVTTPQGEVHAEQVVLSCGGYLAGLQRKIDRAVLPIATYVMVTEPLHERLANCMSTRCAVYDTRFAFDYYRPLKDTRLLWGGRISVLDRSPGEVKRLLYRDLLKVFPQLNGVKIDYAWSGLMGYSRHKMPQIGTHGDGLWWLQAFGGHGVAPTTALGDVMASALAENDPTWREYANFSLVENFRPVGYLAAQASYWWYEAKDWLKEYREG